MAGSVALALSEGVPIFELAGPCAIFGMDRTDVTGTDWYSFKVCAPPNTSVDKWFTATTPHTYDALIDADTVIVPACHDAALTPAPDLVEAVAQAAQRGSRIASICTGAFVLAAAGLLDGRRAATHWRHADTLAQRFPRVLVDPSPLYIDHGDVLTSAGKSAGIDLCLHLVRTDYGAGVANQLARILVSPPHREGNQRQFIEPVQALTESATLGDTMAWVQQHLNEPLTIDQLAQHAGVSPRTLHRHFVRRTGAKPLAWLNAQRVRRAQHLLETTDLTVEHIASLCGFGSSPALRRHVQNVLGTTPDAYRRAFAGTNPTDIPTD